MTRRRPIEIQLQETDGTPIRSLWLRTNGEPLPDGIIWRGRSFEYHAATNPRNGERSIYRPLGPWRPGESDPPSVYPAGKSEERRPRTPPPPAPLTREERDALNRHLAREVAALGEWP